MMAASSTCWRRLLLLAGLYQLTPLKRRLSQCQSPLAFIARRGGFHTSSTSALKLGGEHGLYCVGCCWALMAILFVGGVMNVAWIAGLTAFALAEKITPAGRLVSWIAGAVLTAGGVRLLLM